MESGSPWSTPTQSEIGEAESQLKFMNELKSGVDRKLMVRELGDGEPSDHSLVAERPRNDSVRSSKSKSPVPEKARKSSQSPTKGRQMDPEQSNGEPKGARGRLLKQQSLPHESTEPKGRGRLRKQDSEIHNGSVDNSNTSSAATTTRTSSTAATDVTTSSNSSGTMVPQSPTKSPSKSPSKSPTKRAGVKTKARDVLQVLEIVGN